MHTMRRKPSTLIIRDNKVVTNLWLDLKKSVVPLEYPIEHKYAPGITHFLAEV